MAAYILSRTDTSPDGPQPFDPARHMRQVAELVASVFSEELDARGRTALNEMKLAGKLSPVIGGTLTMALFNDFISGHVWMEGGQIIGNVTVQPLDQVGLRWRISNVAVLPAYRRRGIARALMLAALREIVQRQGSWAVLQVRADNAGAQSLYDELGFTAIARDAVWRLDAPPVHALPVTAQLVPLRTRTGGELFELARAARSPLSQWADPVRSSDYQVGFGQMVGEWLGNWTGLRRVERWGAWQDGQLTGAVETRSGAGSTHSMLRFAVRPSARGGVEQSLIAQGLRSLGTAGSSPVLVAHDGEHEEGVAALRAAGFVPQRDLITMRRRIGFQEAL